MDNPGLGLGLSSANIGGEYDQEEIELIKAIDRYRRRTGRRFPTCTEILKVAKSLGYRKVDENGKAES